MPCYDSRDRISVDELNEVKGENRKITASLCALLNELERRGIVHDVIAEASRNGLIDLVGFYKDHKKDDKSRLAFQLHKFSKDEQAILKELLNK